jgi:hypothetical protein
MILCLSLWIVLALSVSTIAFYITTMSLGEYRVKEIYPTLENMIHLL